MQSEDSEEEVEEEEAKESVPSGMNWAADTLDGPEGADEATRRLLRRKEQLETRRAAMERRRQRMQVTPAYCRKRMFMQFMISARYLRCEAGMHWKIGGV